MNAKLFTNVMIFDGTGSGLFPGEVLVEGNRIKKVAKGAGQIAAQGAEIVDGGGATLMPGLIESHAHIGFGSSVGRIEPRRDVTPEVALMRTAHCAKVLLDYGYTSAYSGGSANAAGEVALREEFAKGYLPGPRLKACSFERSAADAGPTGRGGGTGRFPGIAHRPSSPENVRQFVTDMADLGCDSVKFVISGEGAIDPGSSQVMQFYDEEIAAGAQAARERGLYLNAHVYSSESVQMALRHRFRVLYHCTWADEKTIDMLEAHKKDIFVAPGPGVIWNSLQTPGGADGPQGAERREKLAMLESVMPELKKRGMKLLPGGDYGFPFNPMGKNAFDIEYFVTHFGFTPAEALSATTKLGGEIMDMASELGEVREGYLADMLLIDGDPLKNIKLLQDKDRILMVMKDGKYHRTPEARRAEPSRVAAE